MTTLERTGPAATVAEKARGRFRYLADAPPAGTLTGAVLRSPHPHALIRHIDLSAARALPGVSVVLGPEDLPDGFRYGLRHRDQPVLADRVVRYRGEPVALLAAEDDATAAEALSLIRVDYQPLSPVTDPEAALEGGPALHDGGNLCHAFAFDRGNARAALDRAAQSVTLEIETPRQMHAALELEGGVAWRVNDSLIIRSPSQDPYLVARTTAELLDVPIEAIDVTGAPIGGGFGGKEDLHVQLCLALLAWHANAAVRLVMSREDSTDAGYKRHPFRIRLELGCDVDGRLAAMDADVLADTGAYASHGPEVLDTAMECIQNAYRIPEVRLSGRLAYTNNGVSGAFRGFGAVQTQCAVEAAIDMLADRAGIERVAFRRMNLPAPDAPGPLDQDILPMPELAWVTDRLAAQPRPNTDPEPRYLRGAGRALVRKGEGFGAGGPNAAAGRLELADDGRITLASSLIEMGQGIEEATSAILAAEFGVDAVDVTGRLGLSAGPDSGPTSASRGSQIILRLVRAGKPGFTAALLAAAAARLGADDLALGPGGIYRSGRRGNRPDLPFNDLAGLGISVDIQLDPVRSSTGHPDAHHVFTASAAEAVVVIDRWTGMVRAEQVTMIPACGKPLIPTRFAGQLAGSAVQAAGFVLTETLPAEGGVFQATNLDGYFVPTIADAPRILMDPVLELSPHDPFGIRGVGEIGLNAAAILCALRDGLGEVPARLPVSPGWVLDILSETSP